MAAAVVRVLAIGLGVSAVVWPAAWAAPATDNLYPNIFGPSPILNCTNDPDGGDGRIRCQTDDATVYWYMDSHNEYELESDDRADVTSTVNSEYEPTNLNMVYDSTPVFEGSGETDIVYQEGSTNLDDNQDGVTWCNDAVNGTRWDCDQQYVRMRGNGVISVRLACHETGHAIGFTHGRQAVPSLANGDDRLGCMTTPVETIDLRPNQVQNINANWNAP